MVRLCTSLDWNKDGDMLAIAQDRTGMLVLLPANSVGQKKYLYMYDCACVGILYLWNAHNDEVTKLDTGMKYVQCACNETCTIIFFYFLGRAYPYACGPRAHTCLPLEQVKET